MNDYNCTLPKLRTYKGSRYVPVFATPLQWDAEKNYGELTVVYNCGRTYISRQPVPVGSPLPEYPLLMNEWWATYADYNAQIEMYRAEVRTFSTRYDEMFCWLKSEVERIEKKFDELIEKLDAKVERYYTETQERITTEVNTINERVTTEVNTINERITTEVGKLETRITEVNNTLTERITEVEDKGNDGITNIVNKVYAGGTVNEDGSVTWPTTDKIAIGNMNWYTGANSEHYIKTADDGDGDMRAE